MQMERCRRQNVRLTVAQSGYIVHQAVLSSITTEYSLELGFP